MTKFPLNNEEEYDKCITKELRMPLESEYPQIVQEGEIKVFECFHSKKYSSCVSKIKLTQAQ